MSAYRDIQEQAARMGITALKGVDLAAYAPLSDGCSGGLSRLYGLGGKHISCHKCCVAHDFLYEWGGSEEDRKKADELLRWCAARAGKDVPGWLEDLRGAQPGQARLWGWLPPLRKCWRCLRSWLMYAAVRLFGKSHWEG